MEAEDEARTKNVAISGKEKEIFLKFDKQLFKVDEDDSGSNDDVEDGNYGVDDDNYGI